MLSKRSNVIDNLDHDIRHSNYFFGRNLQLDEGVVAELEGVGDMMVQGEIVEYIVVVEHMLDHMKEVVVVEVVLVEFRHKQQLNFCDHMLEFRNHRRDLEGIEDGLL
jgi:tetrahydromethanopterin S-methyltransferase subunit F